MTYLLGPYPYPYPAHLRHRPQEWALTRILAPDERPVSLQDAKEHVRIDHQDDDDLIGGYLDAAIAMFDGPHGLLQMALKPQTWEMSSDRFVDNWCYDGWRHYGHSIEIPLRPLIEVQSVKYDDANGFEQTMDPADYVVDAARQPGRIAPVGTASWPVAIRRSNSVRIRFRAGHADQDTPSGYSEGSASTVPGPIKVAILMTVGDMYEFRETVAVGRVSSLSLSTTIERLILPFRPQILA